MSGPAANGMVIRNGKAKHPTRGNRKGMQVRDMAAPEEFLRPAKPVKANLIYVEDFGALQRFAFRVKNQLVSLLFFLILMAGASLWLGWLGWNKIAPKMLRIKPYPAFMLWLFRYY